MVTTTYVKLFLNRTTLSVNSANSGYLIMKHELEFISKSFPLPVSCRHCAKFSSLKMQVWIFLFTKILTLNCHLGNSLNALESQLLAMTLSHLFLSLCWERRFYASNSHGNHGQNVNFKTMWLAQQSEQGLIPQWKLTQYCMWFFHQFSDT